MFKISKKQKEIVEKYFDYFELEKENNLYLETWTNGGVDMYIELDKDKTIISNLKNYLDNFDIDEEIDLYRQDKKYKNDFTIRESLEDFENWINYIKNIIKELEGSE